MASFSPKKEWQFNGRAELEQFLGDEQIDRNDICLVGSMSLSVRGIREHHDVDIAVGEDEYNRLSSAQLPPNISLSYERYKPIGISTAEVLYNERYHDIIDGFKIIRPEVSLSYKKYRNRPKDADDVTQLQQYRNTASEWDEHLYQSISSGSSASLLSRGIKSLRNDGFVVTGIKTAGFLERRYQTLSTVRSYLPSKEIKVAVKRLSSNDEPVSSAVILINQYHSGEFCAMDLVVRYQLLLQKDEGEPHPEFTERSLIPPHELAELEELRETKSEIVAKLPVRINHKYQILNPNVFAAKIWHGLDDHQLSILFQKKQSKPVDWLTTTGLASHKVEQLQRCQTNLLEDAGVLFYAILWPPSKEYHDEIEQSLGSKTGVTVRNSAETKITDMYSFVHDVYDAQQQHTSDKKIDEKIELINRFEDSVRILTLELQRPRIRDGISLEMESVKNDVRQKFVPKLSQELYYSILHVTDNYIDNKQTNDVIQSYV